MTSPEGSFGSERVRANPDGSYELSRLTPGTWALTFFVTSFTDADGRTVSPGLTSQKWRNKSLDQPADPIVLAEGQSLTDVDVTLEATGSISGSFTLPDGYTSADLDRTYMRLIPTDGSSAIPTGAWALDGSKGTWTATDVPPDTYDVQFSNTNYWDYDKSFYVINRNALVPEFYDDSLTQTGATEVTVGPGEDVTGIDFAIEEGNSITGFVTVLDDAGPDATTFVAATSTTSSYSDRQATGGGYELNGLPAGTYTVTAEYRGTDGTEKTIEYAGTVDITDGDASGIDISLVEPSHPTDGEDDPGTDAGQEPCGPVPAFGKGFSFWKLLTWFFCAISRGGITF